MHRPIRAKYLFLAVLFFISFSNEMRAALDYGLVFRSYEVSPKERTSLIIPASAGSNGNDSHLYFTDSLRIDFTLKLNLNIGKFGYICSVILGKRATLDVLLYTPAHSAPAICATSNHDHMIQIPVQEDKWHEISISCTHEGDSVALSLDGQKISKVYAGPGTVASRICFGKNNLENYETVDVAPMVIKDLCITTESNNPMRWKLTGDINDLSKKTKLAITNPLWLKRLNHSWTMARNIPVPSVSYICTDDKRGLIYIISEKMVSRYDVSTMTLSGWQTVKDIRADLTTNDFIILEDGTLAYLDIDTRSVIRFDMHSHDWECDNPRTKRSIYLHDNILYDSAANRYLQLFGYGQHRYQKSIKAWNPESGEVTVYDIDGLTPRYMSAAALRDGKIYAYSGKGNTQGAQEFGAYIYNDLVEIDLDAMTAKTLWKNESGEDEVAASNLIPESNRNSFLALTFSPKSYSTSLQLKRIDIDGTTCALGQSIPFNFLDIESEAKLMFCESTNSYYAIIAQKNNDGQFAVSIYTILAPPCAEYIEPQESVSEGHSFYITVCIVVLLLCCLSVYVFRLIRRKTRTPNALAAQSPDRKEKNLPGIYLLGGFKVINKAGKDISGNFSPLMKQLLSIIILNSGNLAGGISNTKLKEALWYDKSDNSYNNNRGVTLTKIRTYLQDVDQDLAIISNNGHWSFDDPHGACDYLKAQQVLGDKSSSLDAILEIAAQGNLLPDVQTDWLDRYKSGYETQMLTRLRKGLESIKGPDSELRKIQIADAILVFDTLDEDSVRLKCQCLIATKRVGAAKRAFDQFCSNYHLTLGEEFSENFTEFIKNQAH